MISSLTALQRRFAAPLAASCLALAVSAMPQSAHAVDVTLTAEFKPSALNPANNKFIDVTPITGVCEFMPQGCQGGGRSFSAYPITARYEGLVDGTGVSLTMPGAPRQVVVRNADGDERIVYFSANLLGGRYVLSADVKIITGAPTTGQGHIWLWNGGGWVYAPAPCRYSGEGGANYDTYSFAWRLPDTDSACTKTSRFAFDFMRYDHFSLGYTLSAPDPLAMPNGVYTGQIRLEVGNGKDIDFGPGSILTGDNELVLNFVLTVDHQLKVTFPDASPKVSLVPIGGWQQWTEHNRKPARLQAELPFTLTSSTDFSVKLRCNGTPSANGHCPLSDGANPDAAGTAEVKVDVSMPGVSSTLDGKPASHFPLVQRAGVADARFRPNGYIANRHSRLRFIVDNEGDASLDRMLARPGSHWEGEMTLIFDSEP